MIQRLRKALIIWRLSGTESGVLAEHYRLLTRSALRCAYDMVHCAAFVRDKEMAEEFHRRSQMWVGIFDPCGKKSYRDELHIKISDLRRQIDDMNRHCEEHGIPCSNSIPF